MGMMLLSCRSKRLLQMDLRASSGSLRTSMRSSLHSSLRASVQ